MAQSDRMVNYRTSQYELLNFIFYLSCFGVFQCARDILQVTVLIDHPVVGLIQKIKMLKKIKRKKMSFVFCHVSLFMYHLSSVTCYQHIVFCFKKRKMQLTNVLSFAILVMSYLMRSVQSIRFWVQTNGTTSIHK